MITATVQSWWALRSEESRIKQTAKLEKELEEYKLFLNNPINFQAECFRRIMVLIVFGFFTMLFLIFPISLNTTVMRHIIAPLVFPFNLNFLKADGHGMLDIVDHYEALVHLMSLLMSMLSVIGMRYALFNMQNFFRPSYNLSRIEEMLSKLKSTQ